jgi:prepilin-type N-terminal cleavage/methylation domain-containing protein
MKKQGFTLIELMVVIVIMGILAAVAVPKLFGMIAKSKASEVPTAAGTWINMQDAYFQEKANVGNWVDIGYSAPGTKGNGSSYASNVFTYTGNESCGGATACYWYAQAKQKLNDCQIGEGWKLDATAVNAGTDGNFTAFTIASNSSDTKPNCKALTASWDNLVGSH